MGSASAKGRNSIPCISFPLLFLCPHVSDVLLFVLARNILSPWVAVSQKKGIKSFLSKLQECHNRKFLHSTYARITFVLSRIASPTFSLPSTPFPEMDNEKMKDCSLMVAVVV